MYGKNAIASKRVGDFSLKEIWFTLQGEGPWAGLPAVFVRLAGCNLRCSFCDTAFEGGVVLQPKELADRVAFVMRMSGCLRVVVTGGEPLLQPVHLFFMELDAIIGANDAFGIDLPEYQIETAGTVWPNGFEEYISYKRPGEAQHPVIVCSPKTPKLHPQIVRFATHWKYIIDSAWGIRLDGFPHGVHIVDHRATDDNVYVQPCDMGEDREATLRNHKIATQIALAYGFRLSVQMHKLPGVELP